MSSDAHRRHQIQHPRPPRCKQCDKEPRVPNREDGLGMKCAHYKDTSLAKAAKFKAKNAPAK
jgi:hypothetical protein